MEFSERLRGFMEERDMRQADLCRVTGIQTSLMSNYLRGIKSPTMKNAILMADALHISLDELMGHPAAGGKVTQYEDVAERALLDLFSRMTGAQKTELIRYAQYHSAAERMLLDMFSHMTDAQKTEVIHYAQYLTGAAETAGETALPLPSRDAV